MLNIVFCDASGLKASEAKELMVRRDARLSFIYITMLVGDISFRFIKPGE